MTAALPPVGGLAPGVRLISMRVPIPESDFDMAPTDLFAEAAVHFGAGHALWGDVDFHGFSEIRCEPCGVTIAERG